MTKIITLMTALVPTIGHGALIDFCANLATIKKGVAHIIVGTQPSEPVPGDVRAAALSMYAERHNMFGERVIHVHEFHKTMPQSPEEMPVGFWELWRDTVLDIVGPVGPDDIFVASELYGFTMAKVLECQFLPFNRYRDMLEVKGTTVRRDILGRFHEILHTAQPYFQTVVTIFGPESCGKTTMAKRLANDMNGLFVPEWAREYLETLPTPETTDDRMLDIVYGQAALQASAVNVLNKPWIFQDTDLLSTLGYYEIFGGITRRPEDYKLCLNLFQRTKSDIYIVMNDLIPFEPDPLRYGGDKRESTKQYWIDLLEKNNCSYYVVNELDHEKQFEEIATFLINWHDDNMKKIVDFQR